MEAKLDELLSSFDAMKKSQQENQADMSKKLEKLERDVQAGQDVAAERVVKKAETRPRLRVSKERQRTSIRFQRRDKGPDRHSIVLGNPSEAYEPTGCVNSAKSSGGASGRFESLGI